MTGKGRALCLAFTVAALTAGCRKSPPPPQEEREVLLSVAGEQLLLSDVEDRIPTGIEPEDSAALFEDIVDAWVKSRLLASLGESKLPNMKEIEEKVNAYRCKLIASEYLRHMKANRPIKVSSDSVRKFYELHRSELLTESPLVKGVFLKVPSETPELDEIRALMKEGSEESLSRLEGIYGMDAMQYDYFVNVWVDWKNIAEQIPYRFYDPDAFLQANQDFETIYNGSVYLLHISDYLPSGSEQPFDFAKKRIAATMEQTKISTFEQNLVSSLVRKAIKEGTLEKGIYDPLTHRIHRDADN